MIYSLICWLFLSFPLIILLRIIILLWNIKRGKNKFSKIKRNKPVKTIICVGSGGHTTEMLKLIKNLNSKNYNPRYYFMANNDHVSEEKIISFETKNCDKKTEYKIVKIPRSRAVNQSYFTSIFTTLHSILFCVPIVLKIKPDLILCNGPGTCIPICLIAFLMKVFYLCSSRIVFIESICRVESLSLTGKILNYFADNFVVQWKELQNVCKRADYLGQLF